MSNIISQVCHPFFSTVGVGINVPPPAAAAVQPPQQTPAAPQQTQIANMQAQASQHHQQLLMKQQQAFLSPQSNQQVGRKSATLTVFICHSSGIRGLAVSTQAPALSHYLKQTCALALNVCLTLTSVV